jgi:hypothetical protein
MSMTFYIRNSATYKGCHVCQKFGDLQLVPATELHPIIKRILAFQRMWIGLYRRDSSFIIKTTSVYFTNWIVSTDYFTKWTEVVALKNMTHSGVIEFITEHIIY